MQSYKKLSRSEQVYRSLLLLMALFLFSEFIIHFFGLPILEHDRISLPTHDRYIALYGLTLAGLLTLLATTHRRDKLLYRFSMAALFLGGLNAVWISITDGYQKKFNVTEIDSQLGFLGVGILAWYIALKIAEHKSKRNK